jgi:predicted Zn-dependent protease with MMP-like domain
MAGSRRDRLEQFLERGFECIENGDPDGAATALERARRIQRDHPDVFGLDASLAALVGDGERALAGFERQAALLPDDPMPVINAATVQLHSLDDPEAALATVNRALELVDDEMALFQAVRTKSEALIVLGGKANLAEARATLGELSTSVVDDPADILEFAEMWLDAGDPATALKWAERVVDDPELAADAHHVIGFCHADRDDHDRQTAAWRRVRALDLALPAPPWTLSADAFDRLAHDALDELPARARELLGNVPILVEPMPSDDLIDDGIDPRILGLFSGAPFPEHASVGGAPVLNTIHLFQRNIEAAAADADDLAEQIRITVLHETAHFFGLDEDDLEKLGLD